MEYKKLLGKLLRLHPDYYSMWNFRKEVVLQEVRDPSNLWLRDRKQTVWSCIVFFVDYCGIKAFGLGCSGLNRVEG